MYGKFISFLNINNILCKPHYGFRSKHSTIHPILHLLSHCAEISKKQISKYTMSTLCDLSKAFNVITHKFLLQNWYNYGIRGIVNKWFENYFSDKSSFFLDNTMAYMSHCDLYMVYASTNKTINDLYEWFCLDKLALNANNTK